MNQFKAGQRVIISPSHHWARGATGAVMDRESEARSSLKGIITCVWVAFDAPQTDADGDGPYLEAEINAQFLHAV